MSGLADPKPARSRKRPATEADREARLNFKVAVLATDGRCLVHDDPADCEGRVEVHHAVTRQQLRQAGRSDLEWSPLNGMTVCELAHRRHTRAVQRIGYERLPQRVIDFAREHGFLTVLDRYYPKPPS